MDAPAPASATTYADCRMKNVFHNWLVECRASVVGTSVPASPSVAQRSVRLIPERSEALQDIHDASRWFSNAPLRCARTRGDARPYHAGATFDNSIFNHTLHRMKDLNTIINEAKAEELPFFLASECNIGRYGGMFTPQDYDFAVRTKDLFYWLGLLASLGYMPFQRTDDFALFKREEEEVPVILFPLCEKSFGFINVEPFTM